MLVVAPFERGRGQGGSQRATAVAERLEERGVEVEWQAVPRRRPSRLATARALARGRPSLTVPYRSPARPAARPDVVLVAHSYLVPVTARALPGIPMVVDFHNLEWQHLADGHDRRDGSLARRGYDRRQVSLMQRLERATAAESALSLFVSEEERAWARAAAPGARTLLVRSVLPRHAVDVADEIARRRAPARGEVVYVGTLTFPTNVTSLERFLSEDWPAIRAADPALRLTVAGACAPGVRARLEHHPGVRALGFVDDLVPLLASCQAVVMPFDGAAGTSLRALLYALAGLPVIGSPLAFRGLGFAAGVVARRPEEWVAALAGDAAVHEAGRVAAAARRSASALQRDPGPWDALWQEISAAGGDVAAPGSRERAA